MSRFNASVSVPLDELCDLHRAADLYDYMKDKAEKLEAKLDQAQKMMDEMSSSISSSIAENAARLKAQEPAIADARNFLSMHDKPLQNCEIIEACRVIRGLMAAVKEVTT